MNAEPILRMEGVWRSFPTPAGPVTVLRDVHLAVRPGEFVCLTGPSGSGKTTLLHLAGMLDRPTAGRITLAGRDVMDLDERQRIEWRKHRVGMVFQRFCLLSHRTVLENVLFRFRYLDTPAAEATRLAVQALEQVGLSAHADQPARLLSGGEMQRVAIARAIAQPPDLLLVDEPTGNLDPATGGAVMERFLDLHRQGITIVMATHNPAIAEHAGRRLECRAGILREAEGRATGGAG